MKKTFVAVLLAALMLAVIGVTMSLAAPETATVTITAQTPNTGVLSGIAFPGDLIVYTMLITGSGPDVGFVFVDMIPENTTYVSYAGTPSGGHIGFTYGPAPTGTISLPGGGSVAFPVGGIWYKPEDGSLGSGDHMIVTLTVKVNDRVQAGTMITNAPGYYEGNNTVQWPGTATTRVGDRRYLPIVARQS